MIRGSRGQRFLGESAFTALRSSWRGHLGSIRSLFKTWVLGVHPPETLLWGARWVCKLACEHGAVQKLGSVSVRCGCRKRLPQTRRLKQQKSISSQFWKLEVQNQVANGVGFWCGLSSRPAGSRLLSVSYKVSSLCTHTLDVFSFYKDTSIIGLGPCSYYLI